LEVVFGKIVFSKHPFQEEDEKLYAQLKEKIVVYRERIDLALIPYYMEIKKVLETIRAQSSRNAG
jgi:hypothetical protein